jgi:multidrug efflux pump subunit AcrB
VDELKGLHIKSQTGETILLEEIAEIKEIQSLEYINSYNGIPSITMDAYMQDGYSTYDLEHDMQLIIDEKIDNRINVIYKGDNELTNELMQGMVIAFIIAIIVIYLIMYVQFKTLRQPLFVLVSIPLSFIGSLIAMLFFGEKITLTSLLGIVSLTGIVVNNGILLVDYINKSREDGEGILDSCVLAVKRRIRPILLTSATTILGLIPLALFGGDFFRPMAIAFMGGVFSSTIFVLFLVPGLYYFSYHKAEKKETK